MDFVLEMMDFVSNIDDSLNTGRSAHSDGSRFEGPRTGNEHLLLHLETNTCCYIFYSSDQCVSYYSQQQHVVVLH